MFNGLFQPRPVKDFAAVLARANALIRQKRFDRAITLYMDIHHAFEAMPPEYQKKFEKDVDILFKELTLYMRVNEAYVLAKAGSMGAFRRELDRIHDLTFELESDSKEYRDLAVVLEFAKANYQFFLDVYTYKVNAKSFRKKVQHIRSLVQKKRLHEALKEYAHLLIIYNKVAKLLSYGRRLEFYETMKLLFKQLSIQRLLALAVEKPRSMVLKTELDKQMPHILRGPEMPSYEEHDTRYDILHALVKKGELKKAFDVYAKIANERARPEPYLAKLDLPKAAQRPKVKRKRRTILDQEYKEKFDAGYKRLHHLLRKGDFHTAKKMLKSLK